MSIKRRSTGSGKVARKQPTSAARERVNILPAKKMVPGDEYVGWLCKNDACGLLIAIADIAPADAMKEPPPVLHESDYPAVVMCPHCQMEDLYRWNARKRHPFVPKSA